MAKKKDIQIDYKAEGLLFNNLKKKDKKLTHAEFCERRSKEIGKSLSLAYFRKVLGKLKEKNKPSKKVKKKVKPVKPDKINVIDPNDWVTLKAEFMSGAYKSKAAFAREMGLNPRSYAFEKNTVGWSDEKKEMDREITGKTIENLIEERAADKARDMYAEALTTQWLLFDLLKDVTKSKKAWKAIGSVYTANEAANFVINMQKAFEAIMPNIQGLEKMAEIRAIFDGLSDESMEIDQAAIEFMKLGVKLPEPMRVMLQKKPVEEEAPEDGEEITEEMILARREQMLLEIQVERTEFVAQRKKEVKQIKKDLTHVEMYGENGELKDDKTVD